MEQGSLDHRVMGACMTYRPVSTGRQHGILGYASEHPARGLGELLTAIRCSCTPKQAAVSALAEPSTPDSAGVSSVFIAEA